MRKNKRDVPGMISQKDIFLRSEGNAWFRRNKDRLITDENYLIVRMLDLYHIRPEKALEIGCSNGYRLAYLQKKYGCSCMGVEPSSEAVWDGLYRFPDITLVRGLFSDLPTNETFDLVIAMFVFHWVDRSDLAKCASEADRVLDKGGFLIIGDFFPDIPCANKYHHLPDEDVKTYKQDYPSIFTSLGTYSHIAHLSCSHRDPKLLGIEQDGGERISASLLLKRELD
jgi:SAM-dependent methyltransferase